MVELILNLIFYLWSLGMRLRSAYGEGEDTGSRAETDLKRTYVTRRSGEPVRNLTPVT